MLLLYLPGVLVTALTALVVAGLQADPPAAGNGVRPRGLSNPLPQLIVVYVGLFLSFLLDLLSEAAAIHLIIKNAAGRPTGIGESFRFGLRRLLPLFGWTLFGICLVSTAYLFFVVPGIYLSVVLFSSLACVVVVERANVIGRAFDLIKYRFWATAGRMLMLGLLVAAEIALPLFLTTSPGDGPPIVLNEILASLLAVPIAAAGIAFTVVTYAELRGHEQPGTTAGLLADELSR